MHHLMVWHRLWISESRMKRGRLIFVMTALAYSTLTAQTPLPVAGQSSQTPQGPPVATFKAGVDLVRV